EDGIRDKLVTEVQTCALPIWTPPAALISSTARFAPFVSPGPKRANPPVSDKRVPILNGAFPDGLKSPPTAAAKTTTTITTRTAITIHNALPLEAGFGASPEEDDGSSMIIPGDMSRPYFKRSGRRLDTEGFWCIVRTGTMPGIGSSRSLTRRV